MKIRTDILGLSVLLTGLRDIVAPARCLVCLSEDSWLCRECAQELPRFQQRCIVCSEGSPRGATCARHQTETPLAGVISAGSYGSAFVRRGVHWLKFRGVVDVAQTLAALLAPQLALIAPLSVLQAQAALVPIPLHPRRLHQRGFNQSFLIAQALSEQTGIPVEDILQRQRATWAQTDLPHEMREENVAEAFAVKDFPNKQFVLLIDDVTTTGSTLAAAAESLRGGQSQIWGVTVARG